MKFTPNGCDHLLLGRSLAHTLSPQIHAQLFEITGKKGSYGICECEPQELGDVYKTLRTLVGYNVTIPYKCDIIPFLDGLDETAQVCGAVNCVANTEKGAIGYNTDITGFEYALKANGLSLSGKVLLLGFGGAGKMMAAAALRAGAQLTVADLTVPDINELCLRLYKSAQACTIDSIKGEYDLCINATPVGMYPKVKGCPITDEVIDKCGSFFDAIYNPEKTVLIQKAEAQGKKCASGMEMLVVQAAQSHTLWYGAKFTDEQIARVTKRTREILNG